MMRLIATPPTDCFNRTSAKGCVRNAEVRKGRRRCRWSRSFYDPQSQASGSGLQSAHLRPIWRGKPSQTNTILLMPLLDSMMAKFHLLRLNNRQSNPTLTCVQHGEAAAADGRHAAAAVGLGDGRLHAHGVGPFLPRRHHRRQSALCQVAVAHLAPPRAADAPCLLAQNRGYEALLPQPDRDPKTVQCHRSGHE